MKMTVTTLNSILKQKYYVYIFGYICNVSVIKQQHGVFNYYIHWIISSGAPAATVQATWWTKVFIWMSHSPPPLPLPPPHQKMWPSLRMTWLTNKGQVSFTSLVLQLVRQKTLVECRSIQVVYFFLNVFIKVHGL